MVNLTETFCWLDEPVVEKQHFLKNLQQIGDIIKTEWVSGIEIDTSREAEIQSCFSNETKVHVATEKDELDALIENFKLKALENSDDNVNLSNSFGEIRKMDHLIVQDDVSGVAGLSKKFARKIFCFKKIRIQCALKFYKQIVYHEGKVIFQCAHSGLQDFLQNLPTVTRKIV